MPIGVAGAVALGATAVSAGVGLYTSSQQAGATKKAQNAAIAAQQQSEAQSRADLAPWREQGQNALTLTGDLSGANGLEAANNAFAELPQSPDYQFRFNEAQRAVDTSAASRGLLRSGATLRAQSTLGSNLASTEFGAHYNRLLGLAQMGQTAAAGQANTSQQTGQGIAQTTATGGAAQSQIVGQEGQNLQNAIKNGYTAYQQNNGSMYGGQQNALWGGATTGATYNPPVPGNNGLGFLY